MIHASGVCIIAIWYQGLILNSGRSYATFRTMIPVFKANSGCLFGYKMAKIMDFQKCQQSRENRKQCTIIQYYTPEMSFTLVLDISKCSKYGKSSIIISKLFLLNSVPDTFKLVKFFNFDIPTTFACLLASTKVEFETFNTFNWSTESLKKLISCGFLKKGKRATLLRNKMFLLKFLSRQNASKFATYFFYFIFVLLYSFT